MSTTAQQAKIQPYNKQQLADLYQIGRYTLNAWLAEVPELGNYVGRLFTTEQVKKIFDHCGPPTKA
ncbi:MAG: hypothetical protein ACRYFZ_00895 [Janthinobacterium lividum]